MISSSDILKASILIVDDQEVNISVLEQMLRGAGYVSIASTSDPYAVCKLHRENRYSLILLDLQMPALDGFQVMERLKAIETGGYLPVLVQTAQPEHRLRALKAGAKDFISRPFELAEVLLRVHNMIEVRLLHREAETRTEQSDYQAKLRIAEVEAQNEALRASELSYRRLFEAAKDGILILDPDTGCISDVNPFLVELLGFSHKEMVGTAIWELGPFRDIVSNKAKFEQLRQQGYVRYENLPLESRDGRHIAVEFVSNVYPAGDRNVIQCNVRDIRRRKRAEKSLLESEARNNAIVQSALDCIVMIDHEGKILEFNPAAEKVFGYARAEVLGRELAEVIIPSSLRDRHRQGMKHFLATGESKILGKRIEIAAMRSDGSELPVELAITRMKAEEPPTFTGFIRDISERKRGEEALRASEERFRALVMASSDGVYRMSPDWSEMLQLDGLDFLADTEKPNGNWLREYIHPDDQPNVMGAINEAVRTKSTFELEHRVRRVDGILGWTFSRAIPLLDAKGEIVEWFGTASDVTKRKNAEDEIRRLNAELEQRVGERTAQLQAANQELEAFSYSVSHDLRAPLRHVMGFVSLLEEDARPSLSEKNLRHLTTISQAAKRMGDLIDDLLAFSRVGRTELQKTEIDLDQLIQETLDDFQAEINERKVVWQIHPLPAVRADRALLRMALVNLIANAVKFTGARAEAKIEIGCSPNGNGETVIFIRDNGAGFDARYAGKLFGVFQRLHSHDEFEGTGIGLANVQRIIHRHGGRTWAEGVVEGGATFYFSLPNQNGVIHGD